MTQIDTAQLDDLVGCGARMAVEFFQDEEIQKDFIGALRSLAQVGTDVLRDEMKNAFAKWEAERAKKGE